jgi:Stigma-specific protein, Stig1
MSLARALRFIALGLCLAYALPLACGSGGVVGGKCRSGYVNCNGACVDLASNPDHCGSCSNSCPASEGCGMGSCDPEVPRPQGGSSSGGSSSQGGGEAGGDHSTGGDLPDGGNIDAPIDGEVDADKPVECLPPFDQPAHCGDCDTVCPPERPLCSPSGDSSFVCVPRCEEPLEECRGQCVDPASYNSDPDNCGRCGNECASDVCQNGSCVEGRFGNVALLCMDLNATMANSAQTDVLANAVFLPPVNPVRVLAYTRGATPAGVSKVNALLAAEGSVRGRTATITAATSAAMVVSSLSVMSFEVLLVHDLDLAPSGEPRSTAEGWEASSVITSFARAGGVVVVLNGGDGTGEMHELISAANLLQVSGQDDLTGELVFNNAPADALGAGVYQQSLGTSHTCAFQTNVTPDARTIFVLTGPGDEPVVIHRVIAP